MNKIGKKILFFFCIAHGFIKQVENSLSYNHYKVFHFLFSCTCTNVYNYVSMYSYHTILSIRYMPLHNKPAMKVNNKDIQSVIINL